MVRRPAFKRILSFRMITRDCWSSSTIDGMHVSINRSRSWKKLHDPENPWTINFNGSLHYEDGHHKRFPDVEEAEQYVDRLVRGLAKMLVWLVRAADAR